MHGEQKEFKINFENKEKFNTEEQQVAYLIEEPLKINPGQAEIFFVQIPTKHLERGQHGLILNVTYRDGDIYKKYAEPRFLYVNK